MAGYKWAAIFLLWCAAAHAQLYPLPPYSPVGAVTGPSVTVTGNLAGWGNTQGTQTTDTGIASNSIVVGPGVAVVNHLALWGNTLGTKLIDGGTFGLVGPSLTVCPANQFFNAYPTVGGPLTCVRPSTSNLSDISTFSLNTSGSVTAASVTAGVITSTTTIVGSVTGSSPLLILTNGAVTVTIDSLGIPTLPTVKPATFPTQLIWNGPAGSHQTPQEWFEFRGANGMIRYVPGF